MYKIIINKYLENTTKLIVAYLTYNCKIIKIISKRT